MDVSLLPAWALFAIIGRDFAASAESNNPGSRRAKRRGRQAAYCRAHAHGVINGDASLGALFVRSHAPLIAVIDLGHQGNNIVVVIVGDFVFPVALGHRISHGVLDAFNAVEACALFAVFKLRHLPG